MPDLFERFAEPTFKGGRFESHALPVDVLPELATYRDLIIELAKYLFLQNETNRQRVPKGFVESFHLVLRTIEDGSAIPVLERLVPDARPIILMGSTIDFFTQARDQIEEVVTAASLGRALPSSFPGQFIPRFNQFGKRLHDNEYIELRGPGRPTGPRYDRQARKFLILQREREYDASVDLLAEIRGGVIDREQIALRLDDERLVDAKAPETLVRQALDAVESQVRVIGWGTFDQNDRLQRIIEIEEMVFAEEEIMTPTPLEARFAELARLGEGWFGLGSPSLDPGGLANFSAFIHQVIADGAITPPFIYPTPDGNAQAEWSFPSWEVSATASLTSGALYIHATHLASDDSQEVETQLNTPDAVDIFLRFMEKFTH